MELFTCCPVHPSETFWPRIWPSQGSRLVRQASRPNGTIDCTAAAAIIVRESIVRGRIHDGALFGLDVQYLLARRYFGVFCKSGPKDMLYRNFSAISLRMQKFFCILNCYATT